MISHALTSAKYALLSFRRNPAATFFTVIFPILFLLIFGTVFAPGRDDDLSAAPSQCLRDCSAEPSGTASDQCDFILPIAHSVSQTVQLNKQSARICDGIFLTA